jgi:YVTN family beta-propeller protein
MSQIPPAVCDAAPLKRVAFWKKLRKNVLLGLMVLMVFQSTGFGASDQRYYVGETACRKCHLDHGPSALYPDWFASKHAKAFASLAKPTAREIARLSGIDIDPFKSPVCLGCHTTASNTESWKRDPAFSFNDGIQCEYCHGPGSQHIAQSEKIGLMSLPEKDFCLMCHKPKGSHTSVVKVKPFDYKEFMKTIDHHSHKLPKPGEKEKITQLKNILLKSANTQTTESKSNPQYKTPFNLTLSKDGTRLYVVCEASDSLIIIDTEKQNILKEITVQNQPHGVCLSDDERNIFVSNRGSDSVTLIDALSFKVLQHIPVGDEPHGLVTNAQDTILYVANAGSNDISVIDLKTGKEIKRLSGGRGTWAVKRSPDNQSVYITNNLSHYVKFREPSISEVTIIDTSRSIVKNRIMLPEANLVQGVDFAPDGEFAIVTLLRTKNLIPITRVTQGWMITNGFGILWKDGTVDQLLLDEVDNYFADPTDIVITPDGKFAYVSGSGIDKIAAIDLQKVKETLKHASKKERNEIIPNHLGISTQYVIKRIPVGRSPRGLAASPDGKYIYVANGLDDTISIIQVEKQTPIATIDLGGSKEITLQRQGERIFHSAEVTFGRQFSCHTCHPDGGIDGITYDIEPDGLGINPVDNRTLRGILDTAPFKWTGKNPTLSRQCGPRLAVFFTRIDPFTPEQVIPLERYICTIPRNPNRYRKSSEMTEAQRRGKHQFERTHDNSGKIIPKAQRCNICHSGPYFTSRTKVDVGTRSHLDTHGTFDVPHLNNIYETPPYLHDGRSDTLEEIWTRFNPEDKHGVTNDMTKDQLNDLIEYLKTL